MITDAVSYCDEDLVLVKDFAALAPEAQRADHWARSAVENLRSHIKAFYIAAQKNRCCYCNRHLGTDHHRMWDVEHVASRAGHPRFMFEPRNLAACCPDCNVLKGDAEVLVNKRRKTYPTASKDFRVVHPHFDRYEDHIFQRGMIYIGKTEKGKRTIYLCDLLRFAQKFIDWENSVTDSRFEKEVEAALEGGTRTSLAAVEAVVAKLPVKR